MSWIRQILFKVQALFTRRKLEREMADEMALHLEVRTRRNIEAGMDQDEARFAAQCEFGGIEQFKEHCRDETRGRWLHDFVADGRYGLRQLRKNPGFTAVAVFSLALGIGANTAIFSLANEFLFRTLPVKNPGNLVRFRWQSGPHGGMPRRIDQVSADNFSGQPLQAFSVRTFELFRDQQGLLSDVFAFGPLDDPVTMIDGQAEYIEFGLLVSGNYYSTLGVSAFRGRTIIAEDDRPDAPPVAVISHRFWQARFAGDPAVIGKNLVVNKQPVTVIGVTAPDFLGTASPEGSPDRGDGAPDITLPLVLASIVQGDDALKPDSWWLRIMGRLKPGATREQVRIGFEGLFQRTTGESLSKPNDALRLDVLPGAQRYTDRERRSGATQLILPMAMVILVLASACANVANLLIARGAARRSEIAMRLALGASRGRIVRQLLTESVLLAVLGAALGLLVARWGLDAGQALGFPRPTGFDRHVLGFTIALGLVTGIGFGLLPALRTTRLDLTREFQGGSRHLGGRHSRLSQTLLIAQVAVSFVLLVATGLLIRTVGNLRTADVGFETQRLVFVAIDPDAAGYPRDQMGVYYDRVVERLGALPGVGSVTFARPGGFVTWGRRATIAVPGQIQVSGKADQIRVKQIGPNFFETYGMPVLLGRAFGPADLATAPQVAIVNQALVRKYLGEGDPLGQRIRLNGVDREIVGVVRDMKEDERWPAEPFANIPYSQGAPDNSIVTVRTVGDPTIMVASILQAARQVDPNVPRPDVRTAMEWSEGRFINERRFTKFGAALGVLAIGLASVGLYGLMSFAVLRRTREIGLRIALGALPSGVLWAILRDSLRLVGFGVAVGFLAAAVATRLIASNLYGLSATDPLTYGVVALILMGVALVACWLPARRAAKVDPMIALRCE